MLYFGTFCMFELAPFVRMYLYQLMWDYCVCKCMYVCMCVYVYIYIRMYTIKGDSTIMIIGVEN